MGAAGSPRAEDEPAREGESDVVRLARWLEAQPFNRDGADKTWVLQVMRRLERLVRSARLLPGRGPDGPLR